MVWVPLAGPPHLVLPEELWGRLDAAQQDAVLAHELAHLKRRDHWVRRLEALACGLYWWDPVAWWARREVERAEERCCDAWVLWALPTAAGAYAEALVMTAVYLSGLRQPLPLGASGVGRLSPLKGRLQMILSDPTTVSVKRTAPRALLVLGALSLPFLPAAGLGGGSLRRGRGRGGPGPVGRSAGQSRDDLATETDREAERRHDTGRPEGRSPDGRAAPGTVRVMQPLVREVSDYENFRDTSWPPARWSSGLASAGRSSRSTCRPGQVVKLDERLFQDRSKTVQGRARQGEGGTRGRASPTDAVQNELADTNELAEKKCGQPRRGQPLRGRASSRPTRP